VQPEDGVLPASILPRVGRHCPQLTHLNISGCTLDLQLLQPLTKGTGTVLISPLVDPLISCCILQPLTKGAGTVLISPLVDLLISCCILGLQLLQPLTKGTGLENIFEAPLQALNGHHLKMITRIFSSSDI
jgi:hypothetical protein